MYKNLSLYCLIILFSSCNKAMVNVQSNHQEIAPPSNFISELKQLNTSEKDDEFRYDFTETDFKNFKPITTENIFSEYSNLFNLTKDYEMKYLSKTKVKKNRSSEDFYHVLNYQPYYKGIAIDWKETTAYYDSKGKAVKVFGYFPEKLNKNLENIISNEKAREILKSYLDQRKLNFFEPANGFESAIHINQGRIAYRFYVSTFTPFDRFEIYIDAETGEPFYTESTIQNLSEINEN